jgi:hypothetical protein
MIAFLILCFVPKLWTKTKSGGRTAPDWENLADTIVYYE